MFQKVMRKLPVAALVFLSACGLVRCAPDPVDKATIDRLYAEKPKAPDGPVSVYHIGHSLVGRTMPALIAQLAPEGHSYESQSGWGAELQAHWEPDVTLDGADVENDHPRFRDAHEAVGSGDYDALILTEKIGLQDSIDYHDSWYYLARWAEKAWAANPETRVYVYETWHPTDAEEGWLNRVDSDLPLLWEKEIIDRALADVDDALPIYVIPAGQAMAHFVRQAQARGGVGGISSQQDLLPDSIHMNHAANYLVALTHYAVLYGRSPVGLPHEGLVTDTGAPLDALDPQAARLMQESVWEVVTAYPRTGVGKATP